MRQQRVLGPTHPYAMASTPTYRLGDNRVWKPLRNGAQIPILRTNAPRARQDQVWRCVPQQRVQAQLVVEALVQPRRLANDLDPALARIVERGGGLQRMGGEEHGVGPQVRGAGVEGAQDAGLGVGEAPAFLRAGGGVVEGVRTEMWLDWCSAWAMSAPES